jgi:hypothetical protein
VIRFLDLTVRAECGGAAYPYSAIKLGRNDKRELVIRLMRGLISPGGRSGGEKFLSFSPWRVP